VPAVPVITPPTPTQAPAAESASRPATKLRLPLLVIGLVIYIAIFIQSLLSHEKTITWLALLSMNVVGTVGFDLMLRRSSWQHIDRWLTATILQTGLFLPFLAKEIVAPIHFPPYTLFDFVLLGTAVTGLIALQFCNVKALEHLEASVFSVIYNSRIFFATAFGLVFLSESVGIWALLGGLLIFAAIFIIKQKGARAVTIQGIIYGLGAALAISAMNTCEKELIKLVGYEQYIFPMFTIAAIIMWVVVLVRRTPAPFNLLIRPESLLIMTLRACAGIGFSYSLVFGPVAVSSYISSLSVVFIVVFGMLFLGEWDYVKSKIIATAVAILGLTFILIDSLG
jgi:drug/metabolite transporter (DMT)-like permease